MKKTISLLSAIALFVNIYAQKALKYDPLTTQGFVVCNSSDYPNVYVWDLRVFEREYSEPDKFTQLEVYGKKLIDVNYIRLDDRFFESDSNTYALTVTGYTKEGKELVSEDYVISYALVPSGDGHYYFNYYEWYCVSDNYAYQINGHMRVNDGTVTGTGYLSHDNYYYDEDDAYREADKYVYFTPSELYNYCDSYSSQFLEYYNANCSNILSGMIWPLNAIKLYDVGMEDDLHGVYGQLVYGDVIYGIEKTKGPWNRHSVITNDIDITYDWSLNTTISALNDYGNPGFDWYEMNDLECVLMEETVNNDPPSVGPYDEYEDCFEDLNGTEWSDDTDFFDIIGSIEDCINDNDDDDWPWWPSHIDYISVGCISAENDRTVWVYGDSLVDQNSNDIIAPSFTFDKGLYAIRYYFNDKSNYLNIIDLKQKTTSSVEYSDFFSASVFPVPIVNDNYTLLMHSQLKTDLSYDVYDQNGNPIFHDKFSIPANKEVEYSVIIRNLPKGVLVNVFTFSDGSTYSFSSFK